MAKFIRAFSFVLRLSEQERMLLQIGAQRSSEGLTQSEFLRSILARATSSILVEAFQAACQKHTSGDCDLEALTVEELRRMAG